MQSRAGTTNTEYSHEDYRTMETRGDLTEQEAVKHEAHGRKEEGTGSADRGRGQRLRGYGQGKIDEKWS
jgi:hypothetical protein